MGKRREKGITNEQETTTNLPSDLRWSWISPSSELGLLTAVNSRERELKPGEQREPDK